MSTVNCTMRQVLFAAVMLFVRSSASTSEVSSLEVVILRYNSLYAGETATFLKGKYEFRFCQCQTETDRPPTEDSRCVCSMSVPGKAVNKVPAIFSISCVYSPLQSKCLMAEIGPAQWKLTTGVLYVQVLIDGRPISDPAWQSIPLSKTKRRVRLTCPRSQSACPTCPLCINGAIDLAYVVVFKSVSQVDNLRLRDVSETKPCDISKRSFWAEMLLGTVKLPQRWSLKSKRTQQQKHQKYQKQQKQQSFKSTWILQPTANRTVPKQQLTEKSTASNRFGIDTRAFRDQIIALHNKYRGRHGVAPLQQNDTLDQAAENWAKHLAAKQGCLEHQKTDHYGENIYYFASTNQIDGPSLAEATVDDFYEEGDGYDYNRYSGLDFYETGHFTQLVWKGSQRIGVGLGMSHFNGRRRNSCQPGFEGTMAYVVVKYDPPGNVQAERYYFDNVLAPRYK